MNRSFTNVGIYVMAFFAVSVSLYALSYYFVPHGFLIQKGTLASTLYWRMAFYTHAGSGAIALGLGWMQFLEKFRNRNIKRHHLIGKIYIIAIVCFASTSGMVLAFNGSEGLVTKIGFSCLAFTWFYSTINAWPSIRKGNQNEHRIWAIRSYAITLAAVTLRIYLPLSFVFLHLSFSESYPAISWFCWVPNLLIVEWLIVPRLKISYSPITVSQEKVLSGNLQ